MKEISHKNNAVLKRKENEHGKNCSNSSNKNQSSNTSNSGGSNRSKNQNKTKVRIVQQTAAKCK